MSKQKREKRTSPNPEGNESLNQPKGIKSTTSKQHAQTDRETRPFDTYPSHNNADHTDKQGGHTKEQFGKTKLVLNILLTIGTLGAFTAAAIYACYAHQQVDAMNDTAKTTREALTSVQRAFVFKSEITMGKKVGGDTGKVIGWNFTVVWQNSGTTPTRDAKSHISWVRSLSPLPDNFRFADLGTPKPYENTPFVLGPKATASGSTITLTPNDISLMLMKKEHFYIWGWVRYRDVFKDTIPHITEFCDELTDFGDDPFTPHTDYPYFVMTECAHHNCADEECKDSENTGLSQPE